MITAAARRRAWPLAAALTALTALAALAALGGCRPEPSQLVVVVDSDFRIPAQLDEVELVVRGPTETTRRVAPLAGTGALSLPVTLGVVPGPDGDVAVTVTAIGRHEGRVVVQRTAHTTLVRGASRMVRLLFLQGCSCFPGATCAGPCCPEVEIAARDLPRWTGTPPPRSAPLPGETGERASLPACVGVTVRPGDDIQRLIDTNPEGTTFCIQAGVHRLTVPLVPRSRDAFVGEPGAILSGARPVETFRQEGSVWVAEGQTQRGLTLGDCESSYAGCSQPEDVYLDEVALRRVLAENQLLPGAYFFDTRDGVHRMVLADDPRGRRVEAAISRGAIHGSVHGSTGAPADGVVVRGLIIERFMNAQREDGEVGGALQPFRGRDWIFECNEVRWSHFSGICVREGTVARGNLVHHHGASGLCGGGGANMVIERNGVTDNNVAHFNPELEAGGIWIQAGDHLRVADNLVRSNYGRGLFVQAHQQLTVERNRIEDNAVEGIMLRADAVAVVRQNVILRNGGSVPDWVWRAGIVVDSSTDVEVDANRVEGNLNGIVLAQWHLGDTARALPIENAYVHDNIVRVGGGVTGAARQGTDDALFTSRNNRFERNTYLLDARDARPFAWLDERLDRAGWQAAGQDREGRFEAP